LVTGSQGLVLKIISIALGACALFTGLLAARYWYKSGDVRVVPKIHEGFGGGAMAVATTPWLAGAMDAFVETAGLNKTAARLSGWTAVLSALSSVAGALC
jgi:hypothetical protein